MAEYLNIITIPPNFKINITECDPKAAMKRVTINTLINSYLSL